MRKMLILVFVAVVALSTVSFAAGDLHGKVGFTYDTKYIWRGFNVFGDQTAIHPFVDLDLFGSGFGINVTGHRANSGGYENLERWDYTVYYKNHAFGDEWYAMNYMVGYRYYNYPDNAAFQGPNPDLTQGSIDLQEIHGAFSFPNILGIEKLVPTYVLVKLWPSVSGTVVGAMSPTGGTASGFAHIFMLDYPLEVTCPITSNPMVLKLHSEIVYNDGVGPGGQNVDHDWSNAVFGISTDIKIAENITFTPAIYDQIMLDRSVNDKKNQVWAGFTFALSF